MNVAGIDTRGMVSASAAAKRHGLKLWTLCKAIDAGLIPGAESVELGRRAFRLVDEQKLAEYIASRPRCAEEGCDKPAGIASDACSGAHARALETRGTKLSAETREKMAAGKRGKERPDVSERYKRDWREGGPLTRGLFYDADGNVKPYFKGSTRQKHLGRQNAAKPPKPGAPPRGAPRLTVTDEQRAEIEKLLAAGWGRRAIADRLLVSEWLVRNIPRP